ncbi:MAG: recombinase family protein [Tissierellaceae bacterium]|nr:recombinase family protein [Tissierellaceae bacterium]
MMKKVEVIKGEGLLNGRRNGAEINLKRVAAYCRVSTDSEDQLQSYHSQVKYYTDLINENSDWTMAGIYADEAITGTQVDKRLDFQRLINDCMNGDIDMIITKSISRFARNTLDTLKYVRHLKEMNIAVFFEEENINTLTMDGELLLVILSSVAQQEVENISANVKKGLKMKMQRGELVGFHGCLGYDYDRDSKTISVNEDEAEIVKYIFRRYLEGAGGSVIGRELENLGYKSPRGSSKWSATTVLGIIKNEKYKGDLLMGKTFTVDPITKRRLDNFGEEDKFYIKEHHEPIISEDDFDKAQEIRLRRAKNRNTIQSKDGKREKFSRKYAFSCLLECGFCGSNLSRRTWHSNSQYNKVIWQCVTGTKKGKKYCPNSKGIEEIAIEKAFLESYRQLTSNNKDIVNKFLELIESTLNDNTLEKNIKKLEREISKISNKQNSLVDLRLEEKIDSELYEEKYISLQKQYSEKSKEKEALEYNLKNNNEIKNRMKTFKTMLERKEVLKEFDRYVFESIVDKVIVGEVDENGKVDPYKLTFVYKTGFKDDLDGGKFKTPRKNASSKNKRIGKDYAELSSYTSNHVNKSYSHSSDTAR